MLLVLLLISGFAGAETTLDIQTGLDDRFRVGRWSPVFLTVQSDKPRTVIVELRVPNASSSAMTIRQAIGVNTQSQKYVMYAPLGVYYDPLRATLFDAESNKVLAQWPDRDLEGIDRGGQQIGFLVMTAGRAPLMQNLRRNTPGSTVVSHVRYSLLPAAPIGYDSADVLYLNNPDWSQLSVDQQRAMLDWARAGGTIMLFPGPETLPADAPLVGALPCDLGPMTVTALNDRQRREMHLPARFKEIGVRTIVPRAGATLQDLPQEIGKVCVRPIGLGRIAVVSTDLGVLAFNDAAYAQDFHNHVLDQLFAVTTRGQNIDYGYYDTDIAAANSALDRIGDIPNTGGFGFSYIALVVGGLMLIVGPIDWFILRKIGKQPWTWATTTGWIGVFTCGALYAGHLLRSGDLHFRTLRLYDQAADRIVAAEDIALVYAPKSARYTINSDPTTWWQPVPIGNRYNSSAIAESLNAHQTYRGNTPEPMWIDVWNWRFLRGSKFLDQPPMISAKLSFDPKKRTVKGTITNLSKYTLTRIEIGNRNSVSTQVTGPVRGGERGSDWSSIQPGKTVDVSISLPAEQPEQRNRSYYGQTDTSYRSVFALSGARDDAVDRLQASDRIVLYATIENPDTDVTITDPAAVTQHNALLRAVIEPTR